MWYNRTGHRRQYNTAHAHCMLDTDTHSEYLILIVFPRQQRLNERASMLPYTYIACLVRTLLISLLQFSLKDACFIFFNPIHFITLKILILGLIISLFFSLEYKYDIKIHNTAFARTFSNTCIRLSYGIHASTRVGILILATPRQIGYKKGWSDAPMQQEGRVLPLPTYIMGAVHHEMGIRSSQLIVSRCRDSV